MSAPEPVGVTERNGAILACGCWTWRGVMPAQAVGDTATCDLGIGQIGKKNGHGPQVIKKANVRGPLSPEICEPGKTPNGYHCSCWYEQDEPCCHCGTRDLNVWIDGVQQQAEPPPVPEPVGVLRLTRSELEWLVRTLYGAMRAW